MAKNKLITAIDIGSSNIKSLIAEDPGEREQLRVIGIGTAPALGLRKGAVVNVEEVANSISESIEQCEKMAGVDISRAVISIGGSEISTQNSKGVVAIGKADGEVTEDDIERVIQAAKTISIPPNREIIHTSPRSYRLDDQDKIKDPLGMNGVRLEVDALIVESSVPHIKNLTKSVYQAGIEIDEMVLEPLAAARAILSKQQKELGTALINFGGSTTSLAVFEESELIHAAVIPVGSNHITNDIAIGLRTSIEIAEKVKLEYGRAISREINKKDEIDLSKIDSNEEGIVSHNHVAEIIEARLEEILGMVNKELKSIGKAGLLPGGAVLTGGGAKLPQIVDLAKETLRLPAQVGYPTRLGGVLNRVDDPSFATAIGLLIWMKDFGSNPENFYGSGLIKDISKSAGNTVGKVKKWLEKFLP